MKITTAMVLAAGMGTRLRPLTETLPKPLVPVGGTPVILRTLQLLKAVGIEKVVINSHHLCELLEERVTAGNPGLEIVFSREEVLLETGGGIKKALPLLGDGPVLAVNSDAVWQEERHPMLTGLLAAFDPATQDFLLTMVPTERTLGFRSGGDFRMVHAAHGPLHWPLTPGKTDANVVYAGVHVLKPALVADYPEAKFSLLEPWKTAETAGRLHGWLYDAPWADMGTPTGLAYANQLLSDGLAVAS